MNRRAILVLFPIALASVGFAIARAQYIPPAPTQKISPDDPNLFKRVARPSGEVGSPSSAPTTQRSQYHTLLQQFEVPDDRKTYGDFCDFGHWSGTSYAGHKDLPAGYWVYLAPNWYIFQEDTSGQAPVAPLAPRPWGPEQATGAPNTWPQSGDLTTAWASATADGQREWLELTYKNAARPAAVLIYETYNPGAVDRVTGYDADGKEVELWAGADPTPAGTDKGISVIPIHPSFEVSRIRIYLDSPKVAGWNEIDAVGLLDAAGSTHWADGATASSTFADNPSRSVELDVLHMQSAGPPGSEHPR